MDYANLIYQLRYLLCTDNIRRHMFTDSHTRTICDTIESTVKTNHISLPQTINTAVAAAVLQQAINTRPLFQHT